MSSKRKKPDWILQMKQKQKQLTFELQSRRRRKKEALANKQMFVAPLFLNTNLSKHELVRVD